MCVYMLLIASVCVGVPRMLPYVRNVDHSVYVREWGGGLMVGGFEPKAKPIFTYGIPDKFEYQLLPEDWDQFSEQKAARSPSLVRPLPVLRW